MMGTGGLSGMKGQRIRSRHAVSAIALALLVAAGLAMPALLGSAKPMMSEAWVRDTVASMGMAGPLVLVGLMAVAIVASPIPSGPIAMVAGALYGTLAGGALVVAGATLGAFAAFGAARHLGFDAVRRSSNPVLTWIAAPRSQSSLMLIVLGSRLFPFISFDAVSYAAGLTSLSFGRFAVATLIGVIPISFALAAMGAGMAEGGTGWMWIVVLGGGITVLPFIWKWVLSRE